MGLDVLRLKTTPKDQRKPVEREPLFYIDDREFTIPREVPPHIAMKYLRDLRDQPMEVALARLLDGLLGRAAVDALADHEELTKEDLEQLMVLVQRKTQGLLEEVQQGNS